MEIFNKKEILFNEWKEKNYKIILDFFNIKDTIKAKYYLTSAFIHTSIGIEDKVRKFTSKPIILTYDSFKTYGESIIKERQTYHIQNHYLKNK